jgi:hypothetical protein
MRPPMFVRAWRQGRHNRMLAMAQQVMGPLEFSLFATKLRSRELADAIGLDAGDIEREIIDRHVTPGDWAVEHGLDRITFRPVR